MGRISKEIFVEIDRRSFKAKAGITLKKALEITGHKITKYPEKDSIYDNCMNAHNFLRGGGENHADDIFLWSQIG